MGPLWGIHTFKTVSHMPFSTSVDKDLQTPAGHRTTTVPVTKAKLPRFPLLLPKLLTGVNQPHLRIWSICRELSHTGGPLGHRLLMLLFLLCNRPHCQAGTCSLIMFLITITHRLSVRYAEFLKPRGPFSDASVRCSGSSKCLCTLCTDATLHRAPSIFASRAVRKIHPTCQSGLCRLVGQTGTHASNTFSMLSGEPSTTSQSPTAAHIKRITATRYNMLCGGHWLPPSSRASGSPHCRVSC